jgi:hypothetical protein
MDTTEFEAYQTFQELNYGALIQLKAYGASDTFLTGIKGEPMSCNIRDSINYWFVDNHDGQPTKNDINNTTSPEENEEN